MRSQLSVTVRPFRAEEWRVYRDLRLRALADSPDAFGSTLEAEEPKPDEHWAERVASSAASETQRLLVVELGRETVGLALGALAPAEPDTAHVFQMWVAPEARGRGCATALLETLVAWARRANARSVELRVTCGDTPARRLYERTGFTARGDPELLRPGSPTRVQRMTLAL